MRARLRGYYRKGLCMKVATTTRRGTLLLVAMMVALLTVSGVALAVRINGTNGPDRLIGTNGQDQLIGMGGNDYIDGGYGSDRLVGGPGVDTIFDGPRKEQSFDAIYAGGGNDSINTTNIPPRHDYIDCGYGRDTLLGDSRDRYKSCEIAR